MKPPLRTKSVGTKVSEAEFAMLEERARAAGMRLAEWVREVLLTPKDDGPEANAVILAELLALRSLFLNLSFLAAKGESVPEEEMRKLIERADSTKIRRARERLQAIRAESPDPKLDIQTAAEGTGSGEA